MKNTRTFARVISIMLIAVMLLGAFTACAKKTEKSKKTDAELIVGKWETNIDFAKMFEAEAAEDDSGMGDLLKDVELENGNVKFTVNFNEDGTYSTEVDKEQLKSVMVDLSKVMIKAIMGAFGGEGEGEEMSDEDMLAAMGASSWDDLADKMFDGEETDFTEKGKYELKDGKILMTPDEDGKAEEASYTISEKELKLEPVEGTEEMAELPKEFFPITFTKAK